jgi:hypothetical protein
MASLVSRVRLIAQPTKALEYASKTAATSHGTVDTPAPHAEACSKTSGLTPAMTVAAMAIVEDLDVIEDVGAGELARFVDPLAHPLFL